MFTSSRAGVPPSAPPIDHAAELAAATQAVDTALEALEAAVRARQDAAVVIDRLLAEVDRIRAGATS